MINGDITAKPSRRSVQSRARLLVSGTLVQSHPTFEDSWYEKGDSEEIDNMSNILNFEKSNLEVSGVANLVTTLDEYYPRLERSATFCEHLRNRWPRNDESLCRLDAGRELRSESLIHIARSKTIRTNVVGKFESFSSGVAQTSRFDAELIMSNSTRQNRCAEL